MKELKAQLSGIGPRTEITPQEVHGIHVDYARGKFDRGPLTLESPLVTSVHLKQGFSVATTQKSPEDILKWLKKGVANESFKALKIRVSGDVIRGNKAGFLSLLSMAGKEKSLERARRGSWGKGFCVKLSGSDYRL